MAVQPDGEDRESWCQLLVAGCRLRLVAGCRGQVARRVCWQAGLGSGAGVVGCWLLVVGLFCLLAADSLQLEACCRLQGGTVGERNQAPGQMLPVTGCQLPEDLLSGKINLRGGRCWLLVAGLFCCLLAADSLQLVAGCREKRWVNRIRLRGECCWLPVTSCRRICCQAKSIFGADVVGCWLLVVGLLAADSLQLVAGCREKRWVNGIRLRGECCWLPVAGGFVVRQNQSSGRTLLVAGCWFVLQLEAGCWFWILLKADG